MFIGNLIVSDVLLRVKQQGCNMIGSYQPVTGLETGNFAHFSFGIREIVV
jgi:hypothetical protein